MKKLITAIVILSISTALFSQGNDLIVTKKGDSIRCQIDSITNTKTYFKLLIKNQFVNTYGENKMIVNHQIDFYPKTTKDKIAGYKDYFFVGLTFVAMTVNYEHVFRLDEVSCLSIRAGTGYDLINQKALFMFETNIIFGKSNNFFEIGVGQMIPQKFPGFLVFRPAYRHTSLKGFLFKVYPMLFFNLANDENNVFESDWKVFAGVGVSLGKAF